MNYFVVGIMILLVGMVAAFSFGLGAELYFQSKYRNKARFIGAVGAAINEATKNLQKKAEESKGDLTKLLEIMERMKKEAEQKNEGAN